MQARADVIIRRTYARPKDKQETTFETWEEICQRVSDHQQWLWERAKGSPLTPDELSELQQFKNLMQQRKVSVSGRTLWLGGGTDIAKRREASPNLTVPSQRLRLFMMWLTYCGYSCKGVVLASDQLLARLMVSSNRYPILK